MYLCCNSKNTCVYTLLTVILIYSILYQQSIFIMRKDAEHAVFIQAILHLMLSACLSNELFPCAHKYFIACQLLVKFFFRQVSQLIFLILRVRDLHQ